MFVLSLVCKDMSAVVGVDWDRWKIGEKECTRVRSRLWTQRWGENLTSAFFDSIGTVHFLCEQEVSWTVFQLP